MSSFRELKCSQLTDMDILISSLKKQGYNPVVNNNKQTVRGDTSYDNRGGFDVLLRKEDTKLRGDIGFKKTTEGITIGYDSYIIKQKDFDPQVITGKYTVEKAHKTAIKLGLRPLGTTQVKVNGKTVTRMQFEKTTV